MFVLQIVVCQNNSSSRRLCCNVMAHELIHMFDFCRAKVDFTNLEHLACTEVGHEATLIKQLYKLDIRKFHSEL